MLPHPIHLPPELPLRFVVESAKYNALNQRVRTVVGSATTEFVFNAGGQRVSEWNAATHLQLKGKYYWGGKPVAYYTTASGGGARQVARS
jgi:hypothetical protein